MKNQTKNRTLTKLLIALIVVLLTAPALFAKGNPEKKMDPDWPGKKTKQAKLTKEKIDNILDRIEQYRPERAKQLRKLRKADPEKFRTRLRKIMQKWALKKNRKSEGWARRGKGKSFAHDKFGDSGKNIRWAQSQYCPLVRADAPPCRSQFGGRQKMFHSDYQLGSRRGQGFRGRGQGLRSRGRHQKMGFSHGRRGRGQGLRSQGRHQKMGFDHGRRSRGQGLRSRGRHKSMSFDHGQGRRFSRQREFDRRKYGYNRGFRHRRNYPKW